MQAGAKENQALLSYLIVNMFIYIIDCVNSKFIYSAK